MNAEDLALYLSLPSDHPFRIVIRQAMVELYVDHSTQIQKRAYHEFLILLKEDKIEYSSDDWRAFSTCNKPNLLGTDAYQCISLFWSKIAEMSARGMTPEQAKEVVQTSQDDVPDFWAGVWQAVYVILVTMGVTLYYVLGTALTLTRGVWQGFWAIAPQLLNGILEASRYLTARGYALLTGVGAPALVTLADQAALLRAPVIAGAQFVWASGWAAAPYALLAWVLRRVIRAFRLVREGISSEPEEAFVIESRDVFSIQAQVQELDTDMIRQFRDSLQDEMSRTYYFRAPTREELARLQAYNRELTNRGDQPSAMRYVGEGEPIASDIIDIETLATRRTEPPSLQDRQRIQQIQSQIRATIESKAQGVLTADEIESAIRNEAYDRWLIENGQDRAPLNELPDSPYKEFRQARSSALERPSEIKLPPEEPEVIEIRTPNPQLAEEELKIRQQFRDLPESAYRSLAEELSLERSRLQGLYNTDQAAFQRELRALQERPTSTEGGLAVVNARRILQRDLYAQLDALQINVPAVRYDVSPDIMEELALERPALELKIPVNEILIRPEAVPEAPSLLRFGGISAAQIETLFMGAQLVGSIVLLIIGIVQTVQDQGARADAQAELDKQSRAYQQEFDLLLMDLGVVDTERWHYDLRGPLDFEPEQPRTRIPPIFTYGEAGLHYLQFRKDFSPSAYPSVTAGLKRVAELWQLISGGYLRIYPKTPVFGLIGNKPELYSMHWQDALKVYLDFADGRRTQNWPYFQRDYMNFLQEHGPSADLRSNFLNNEPATYWSTYFDVKESKKPSEEAAQRAKRLQSHVERALVIFLAYFRFERNRSSRRNPTPEFTDPKYVLPDLRFIRYHWYHASSTEQLLPAPKIPSLVTVTPLVSSSTTNTSIFISSAISRYGTISLNENGNLIAYSLPALSLILLATEHDMALLTPPGPTPLDVGGLQCEAIPIHYDVSDTGVLTLGFQEQTVTFVGTEIAKVQVGPDLYVPVAPRSYQQPSEHYLDLTSRPAHADIAYMILLNHRRIVSELDELSLANLHPDFLRTHSTYDRTQGFAFGSEVGVLQSEGAQGDWQLTVSFGQSLVNIQSIFYTGAFIAFVLSFGMAENPEMWMALAQNLQSAAPGAFLVSTLSPLRQVINQYLVVPLTTFVANPLPSSSAVALSSPYPWHVVKDFASYQFAQGSSTTFYMYSTYIRAPFGKVVSIVPGASNWIGGDRAFSAVEYKSTLNSLVLNLQGVVTTLRSVPSAEVVVRTSNGIREVTGFAQNLAYASPSVLMGATEVLNSANNVVVDAGKAILESGVVVAELAKATAVVAAKGGVAVGSAAMFGFKGITWLASTLVAPLVTPVLAGGVQILVAVAVGLVAVLASGQKRRRVQDNITNKKRKK